MTTHMPMTPIGDPVSVPSTPTNPTDDPVGTVRVQRDTGVWAVKTSQGDDTGKGQHVWLSPAGVIARDTYVLHHNEVRGWEVGEVRRWRTEEAAQAPVLEGLRAELDAAVIQRDKFGELHLSEAKTHDETIRSLREAQAEIDRLKEVVSLYRNRFMRAEKALEEQAVSDQTPARPELREEYAVEWHHPDGGRTKSISCDRRGSADVILSDGPDWPGSRVVKRTVTTSAWDAA